MGTPLSCEEYTTSNCLRPFLVRNDSSFFIGIVYHNLYSVSMGITKGLLGFYLSALLSWIYSSFLSVSNTLLSESSDRVVVVAPA